MEFEGIIVKDNPGLCRCCLSEGCYKDLSTEYIWMGESEVYADLLMECFDISISQHSDGPNGSNRLICEVCITRLRDACNFKKQVLESEKKFIDMLSRGELRSNVVVYEQPMKEEIQVETVLTTDDEGLVEYLEDVDFLGNGDDETNKEEVKSETIATVLPGRLRSSASKTEKKKSVKKAVVKEGKIGKEKTESGADAAKEIEKYSEKRRKNEIATLLSCLLEFTTVMPFRWSSNKYLCFYCCSNFTSSQKLKDHTKDEHDRAKLKNVLRNISGRSSVKIDISELACKLCRIEINDLDTVIDHLVSDHDAKYDRTVKHYLVPFRLSDEEMTCLECEKTYRFYGTLLAHVYKVHIRTKSFICEICGQGFTFKLNMDSHMKWTHLNNEWRCDSCDKRFPSYYAKRNHQHAVHRTEKLKCPKCPEVLRSAYLKKQHLALVHDVKSVQFRCDLCPKVFTLKNKLSSHRRRVHLNEKSVTCEICGFRVFNNENLKRHMVKHNDARPFECEYCKKAFQRKKTLEFHRRIHTNDRRYVCKECGRAFVQTTSLKLHIRVHHSRGND